MSSLAKIQPVMTPWPVRLLVAANYLEYVRNCFNFANRNKDKDELEDLIPKCKRAMKIFAAGLVLELILAVKKGWVSYPKWPIEGLVHHHALTVGSVCLGMMMTNEEMGRLGDTGTVAWSCLQMNEAIMVAQTFITHPQAFRAVQIARRSMTLPFFLFATFKVLPRLTNEVLKKLTLSAFLYWLPNAALVFFLYLPPKMAFPPVNKEKSYIYKESKFLINVMRGLE
mmetsp:Transcript_45834/g.97973  ORF Transcript_45834/g.97973 Transcript_45834/m.97973 type:complete len:226 (-) Transcript_45834:149-826(-)|eukprot:CAMPEP_0204354090 /NCGR_PEP_ID=MMETSP0469-20131031/33146_1 /ASSEMBLY_ACC=CAM_ASM_000384 /TAXON_ID=2969 /ORGANISM="Oxyrrhis marina" /LENGTH=225 /DNA_ID=CAMNT_0051341113 /DNA_START=23 /DNA_END=700 /DNA_ORIENTATION=+